MQTRIRQNRNVYSGEGRKSGYQNCTVQNHRAGESLIVSVKVKTRYQSYVSTDKGSAESESKTKGVVYNFSIDWLTSNRQRIKIYAMTG